MHTNMADGIYNVFLITKPSLLWKNRFSMSIQIFMKVECKNVVCVGENDGDNVER